MKKIVICFVILLAVGTHVLCSDVGDKAPTFANPDLTGTYHFSKNYFGKSWVLLDFFATYCGSCKEEIPELDQLYKEYAEYGFQVLIFATDDKGIKIVSPYFSENPTSIPVLIDRYNVTADRYEVEALPTIFLIDKERKILFMEAGYNENSVQKIRSLLQDALIPTKE